MSRKDAKILWHATTLFFDAYVCVDSSDSSAPSGGGGSEVTARVVNQMLTEMDGTEDRKGVFVIAATNRPGMHLSHCP